MSEVTNNEKKECLMFLSWQSDRKDCRNFVVSALEMLSKKESLLTITIDRDTLNVPGSPDIGDTIFEKIDRCDLFVADLTLINDRESHFRRTPNPNVLIELGYAIKTLGWERILLLQCIDYGDVEELPFDINHRRICNFTLGLNSEDDEERSKKKTDSKKQVVKNITESIRILLSKNQLFGGKRRRTPKFEIIWQSNKGTMMNLKFKIKNVSSIFVSSLKSHDVFVVFRDGSIKALQCTPAFESLSLAQGEETKIHLNNPMLGHGPGYNNAIWHDIVLKWQFSCEDEDGNIYWYEMQQHIESASKTVQGVWPVKYIG